MQVKLFFILIVAVSMTAARADDPTTRAAAAAPNDATLEIAAAERGYRFLTEKVYLSPDFHQSDFDAIWEVWPKELRAQAADATVEQRRQMAFERYGLTKRPNDDSGRPLQYVVDDAGNWTMNCFSCHGGTVYGQVHPGAPNNAFGLQTLSEEMRKVKFRSGKRLTRMELGSAVLPLGTTHGTSNAVIFGVALMNYRDKDLNLVMDRQPPPMLHHDLDAPPWWNLHKKEFIYIDGFARLSHRGLMQFMLSRGNGPERFREWESDFKDVLTYLQSMRPPKYQGPIDAALAEQGRVVFNQTCADCHGTYGDGGEYPNRRIALKDIGTDPIRLLALPTIAKEKYVESWFSDYGSDGSHAESNGYVAPPLDGIWASAPYLHNGSVPTLWHLLHPEQRPKIWRRTATEIDAQRVGLQIEQVDRVPLTQTDWAIRRTYFDTQQVGKSAAGHDYPSKLSETERTAVLEYLKTL
ncbi:Cytochrome c [Rosistilla oblonga]|uniref:c-type cytochrome n=1 Tax=Rosistilla oblonga TaxID=2527990 RepID=UPI0011877FD4|nr:c-type cytochrome [Rosistilla oblonga]QDV11053.1 Cytochrome c [Rosistilla oblonga]